MPGACRSAEQSETRKAWAKSYAEPVGSPMAGRRRRVPRTIVSLRSVSRCGPPARARRAPRWVADPARSLPVAVSRSRFGRHGQRPKNLNKKDPYTNTEFTIHPICAHFPCTYIYIGRACRPYRKRTAAADRSAVCRDPRAQPSAHRTLNSSACTGSLRDRHARGDPSLVKPSAALSQPE